VAVATVAAMAAVVDEAIAVIMVAVESTGTTEEANRAHHLSSLRYRTHLATRAETETRALEEQRCLILRGSSRA
jgi:hypothetical protein